MNIILDDWQKNVLETEGNIVLRSGRQVGKSTVISIKAAEYAVKNKNKVVIIISAVERQAQLLFEKCLGYMADNYKSMIKRGSDRPTKHLIKLRNGSRVYSLPTGLTGYGIRGYTVDLLIADEASFISEDVWPAISPMIATTKGKMILLSTPFGREGYFYNCFRDPSFTKFHISSLDCPRISKDFLEMERSRMTKMQFAQEYMGEFVDELRRFFPERIIERCTILKRPKDSPRSSSFSPLRDIYLGVDIARLGEDETVLASVQRTNVKGKFMMVDLEMTNRTRLTDTIDLVKYKDSRMRYKAIYIDDAGVGGGVFDVLLRDDQTKRKVVAINNAKKSLDRDDRSKKKLMKEDLYSNLLRMMENGDIALFDDDNVRLSLRSVQYEYEDGRLRIFGSYTHIVEALIRACWAVQDKHLNIWVAY